MGSSPRRKASGISWFVLGFKAISIGLMVGTPLAGVWLASSLAAFANRATWLPVAAGALLFPGLPLAWEAFSAWRARKRKPLRKKFLTFGDRLILRTLAINVVFLVVLVAAFPERAFIALSARGDWMLDGHHGPAAEKTRSALLASASAVEWVYKAAHENPYRDRSAEDASKDQNPTPPPKPTPAPTPPPPPTPPRPTASASGSATPEPPPPETPPPAVPARGYPFPATLHPLVKTIPPEAEATIEGVGRYIAERERDPMLRVKALHDWVADRVAYDAPAYAAHAIPHADGDAREVFRTRVGVCAGYAQLLAALGKVTGDEIVYVVGDARSKSHPMEGEGHAWNAVKIEGNWYLMDPTWDAGWVEGTTFTKHYSTQYLFTPPDQFAISHYPELAKWQLLEKPLSHAEFFRRPVLPPTFFANHLTLVSPDRSQVSTGGSLDVVVTNPDRRFLLVNFAPKSGAEKIDCRGDKHTTFHCVFPAAGTYDVGLFVNDKEFGSYAYAGSVEVNARP